MQYKRVCANTLSIMIKMIEKLDEPWGIKDCQSRHLFMNKAARMYTCTPAAFDLEGKLDCEFPTTWAEQAEGFIEHDRKAESEGKGVSVIETDFWFGRKELYPYISEKIPFRDANGVCMGTLWNARKIRVLSPYVCISDKKPGVLHTASDQSVFTRSEMDMIFYLMKNLSQKEVASHLGLSAKTINNKMQNIYRKTGVNSVSALYEFCSHKNLQNYIPEFAINKGIKFI